MKSSKSKKPPFGKANVSKSKPPFVKSTPVFNTKKSRDRGQLPEGVFIVEGVAAIREYLKYRPSAILKIYAKERSEKTVREELSEFKIALEIVSDDVDEVLPHTPSWAHVRHEMLDWSTFISRIEKSPSQSKDIVLMLDHISDPRNLGAIVRSAAFFGVRHVIVPERRQVLLTQSGVNTAQGGFALTDLVLIVNVARAMEELKQMGYWILGADMVGEPVSKLAGKFERQVLVLGSEDKGLSQNVQGKCDVLVGIPSAERALESLNVSVAAGILLHGLAPAK